MDNPVSKNYVQDETPKSEMINEKNSVNDLN
jgi:hypothetical protein